MNAPSPRLAHHLVLSPRHPTPTPLRLPSFGRYAIRDPKGESPEPQTAVLHPSSVNAKLSGGDWCAPYIAFHECVRTTKLYVRDASPAPLLPLLIFGGAELELAEPSLSLSVAATMGGVKLTVDGWLSVRVQPPRAAANIFELRKRVESRLQERHRAD